MGKTVRVLLVEDELSISFLMSTALEDAGYEVIVAKDVSQAKRLLNSEIPDVIITDIMMPGESGFSLLSYVRKSSDLRLIPVIVSTMLEVEQEAFHEGATAFLAKPFTTERLVDLVNQTVLKDGAPQLIERALGFLKKKQFSEARPILFQILDLKTQGIFPAYASYYLGEISRVSNEYDQAESHYKNTVQYSPDFWRAYNQLGKICNRKKDYHRALTYWKKSLVIHPEQPELKDAIAKIQDLVGA